MPYTTDTFLKQLSIDDRLVQILDTSNSVKYTIDPFSVVNISVSNNLLKISLEDKSILIAFSSPADSRRALPLLQEQLVSLKQKDPLYMDKKIENYVTSKNLQGPQGYQGASGIDSGWIDYSNTSTIVGWSSYTDKVIKYKIIGKTMFVIGVISGTSNSATTSFTIPNNAAVSIAANTSVCINSGGISIGYGGATSGSNVIAFSRFTALNTVSSSWTNSGTKQINFNFIIEIQ